MSEPPAWWGVGGDVEPEYDGPVQKPRRRTLPAAPIARRVPLSSFSAADLLGLNDEAVDLPVAFEQPNRRSTLKGRAVPKRATDGPVQ